MITAKEAYFDFIKRLTHLIVKNPHLIRITLSNIFTMRLVGNKTHGDLAEIAISEFINQYMYDFRSVHVGKDLYRAKEHEEDIRITNEIQNIDFTISLKAYGDGPLQLSTDKNFRMFPFLREQGILIKDQETINTIFESPAFREFGATNVLPLIYDERNKKCSIMVFDFDRAQQDICEIKLEERSSGRIHPVFRFYNAKREYICEVRYGDAKANALQRGLWTHTKNALRYFNSVTGGWIDYSDNVLLVQLLAYALISTVNGHERALELFRADIQEQKNQSKLR